MKIKLLPISLTEKQFAQQIIDLCKLFGWRYYRTWLSVHSPAGFPDIVMVRPPRLIFAELKSEIGKLSPEQEAWLDGLKECQKTITFEPIVIRGEPLRGNFPLLTIPEVYLWRPNQFDEIVELLKQK